MMFLGILRASALYLLAIGFHSQHVSCGLFNRILSSKKSSNINQSENSEGDLAAQMKMLQAKLQALEAGLDKEPEEPSTDNITDSTVQSPLVEEAEDSTVKSQDAVPEDRKEPHGPSDFSNDSDSEHEEKEPIKEAEMSNEEHEQHHVAKKTETDVTSYPSTINLSDGSKSPDASMATPSSNGAAEDMEADREELLKRISEKRTKLVERLSNSDAPFSLEDMTLFLGILRDEADVDPEAVQKVGEKIHTFLGNLGIHGADARSSLENLMEKIIKHNTYVSDMFYGPIQQRSYEASEASEVDAKSDVNPQQDGSVVNEDEIPMKSEKF